MKINKVISVIKKKRNIKLFKDDVEGRMFLSDGFAAYDVSCFPNINTENELATVLNIDDPQNYTLEIQPMPDALLNLSPSETVQFSFASVVYSGVEYVFLTCGDKTYAVNAAYMKPFGFDEMVYIAESEKGAMIIVGGLVELAYILPENIDQTIKDELEEIMRRL